MNCRYHPQTPVVDGIGFTTPQYANFMSCYTFVDFLVQPVFFFGEKKRVPSGQVETNVDSSTAWGRKSQLLVRWQPQLAEQTPDLDKNKRFVVSEHVFLPSIYGYVNRIIGKMMGKTMKFGGIIFSDKPTWSEIYNLIWSIVDMYYGAFVWWNLVVFELIPSSYY